MKWLFTLHLLIFFFFKYIHLIFRLTLLLSESVYIELFGRIPDRGKYTFFNPITRQMLSRGCRKVLLSYLSCLSKNLKTQLSLSYKHQKWSMWTLLLKVLQEIVSILLFISIVVNILRHSKIWLYFWINVIFSYLRFFFSFILRNKKNLLKLLRIFSLTNGSEFECVRMCIG